MTFCLKNEESILKTYTEKHKEIEIELHQKGITNTRIALCHAQVSAMIDAIAEHVFKDAIDLSDICDAKRYLEGMAMRRIEEIAADHPFVQQFWDAFEYLNSIRGTSFQLNHYATTDSQIAINLNEVYKVAARNYQALPEINEMRNLLKTSKRYKFIEANKTVRSSHQPADESKAIQGYGNQPSIKEDRIVKCWIFSNPYQAAGGKK